MKKRLPTDFNTRQYMEPVDFELFYYSDVALASVAPHHHDYYELYFFLEGDVNYHIEDSMYRLTYGDCLLIPPGTSHYPIFLSHQKPYRRFVLWISQDYCTRLMDISTAFGYLMQYVSTTKNFLFSSDAVTFNTIHTRLFSILEEIQGNRFGKEAEILLQVNSLLLYLNRLVHSQNNSLSPVSAKTLFQNLCEYITSHLTEDLSLTLLAQEFFVSKFYIAHLFKDTIGLSVHQYIMKKRLSACKDALLGSIPITQLFLQYGFHDYSSFYRAFKKEYGMSPNEYRQSHLTVEDLPD